MKIKSKQTLKIEVSNKKADTFCRAINKIVKDFSKPGYKNNLLDDDEKELLTEINDTLYCED